jgi:hypothetical protein
MERMMTVRMRTREDELEKLLRAEVTRKNEAYKRLYEAREYARIHAKENKMMADFLDDLLGELNGDLAKVWQKHRATLKKLGYGD